MQLFTINDLISAGWGALHAVWEVKGLIAGTRLRLVFLPLQEFSFTAVVVAAVWIRIFWHKKTRVLSGINHLFGFTENLFKFFKRFSQA